MMQQGPPPSSTGPAAIASLVTALLLTSCAVPSRSDLPSTAGPSTVTFALNGVPMNGYPTYDERLQLVAMNRARADPNNVAAGTADTGFTMRNPTPPLMYDHDASQAARFHCDNLTMNGGGLSHDSYCTVRADVEMTGCDGSAACTCEPGTECWSCTTLGGCGTSPFERMDLFGFTGSGTNENGAAGYSDSWEAVAGWVQETPADATEGHRFAVTSPSSNVVGTGSSFGGSCWSAFYFSDYGNIPGTVIPAVASGIHRPESGGPSTNFTFYANYYDGVGAPTSIDVVIDGQCSPMTLEIGSPENATFIYNGTVPTGCHEYYFLAYDSAGNRATYPTMGSLQVSAGGGCSGDYIPNQMPASCDNLPCGNGACDAGEDCGNCSFDCGACPSVCGNGSCEADEDCASCDSDCGMCSADCGTGVCDADETCTNCPMDCGVCPEMCGDGVCGPGEECSSCPDDCGDCGPCNDGELSACGLGACLGIMACAEGVWAGCDGPAAAGAEVCGNGIDDDCNGPIDDGCPGGPLPPPGPACGCAVVGRGVPEAGGALQMMAVMVLCAGWVGLFRRRRRN